MSKADDLFLSTVVEALLKKLGSGILEEYARIHGISRKLKKWQGTLKMIHVVVDSPEERQVCVGGRGLDDLLLQVAYEMEDLLDLIAVKAETRSSKLPSCLIACFSKMNPHTLLSDRHMASEIEDIGNRLDEVFRLKGRIGFVKNPRAQSSAAFRRPRPTSTSLPDGKLFGREKEMKELLLRLIGSYGADDRVPPYDVVSIVGMGGIGKTALAQELYNHESVRGAFEHRAWACVSEDFDLVDITKSILELIAPSSLACHGKDLHWLQNTLREHLSGKKFLIVLDDVWNNNSVSWQSLLKPFHSARRGSRILVTSRSRRVAVFVGDCDPTVLDSLSSEDCLSVIAYRAIEKGCFEIQPHLWNVAEELVEKCSGLPLTAVKIGWLLRFENNYQKWKYVLDNEIWKEGAS